MPAPELTIEALQSMRRFSPYLLSQAQVAGASSLIAMVIIQAAKELCPFRGRFQQWLVRGWLLRRSSHLHAEDFVKAAAEMKSLANLAGDPGGNEIWRNGPEDLIRQLKSAARLAIAYAEKHKSLVRTLSGRKIADGDASSWKSLMDWSPSHAGTGGKEPPLPAVVHRAMTTGLDALGFWARAPMACADARLFFLAFGLDHRRSRIGRTRVHPAR